MIKKHRVVSIIISIILLATIIFFFWSAPSAPDFSQYEAGKARKTAFFSYFLPIIEQQNTAIITTREQLLMWQENPDSMGWFEQNELLEIADYYRVKDFDVNNPSQWQTLLNRVNTIPASLALAQAANESSWGTSRFAVKGNNYFGQWCFKKGCGLVPKKRLDNKVHEVAAFNSANDSVASYLRNLNSHPAYTNLRAIRKKLLANDKKVSGVALSRGLLKYSERGQHYVDELEQMIRFNKLGQYD